MAVALQGLDLPKIDLGQRAGPNGRQLMSELASQNWLVRHPFGHLLTRHEDCIAVLKDQRWHQAARRLVEFDITTDRGGAGHLTLGFGLHYCLGANLARAELQEALTVLAQRMPNLRLDGEIEWKPDGVAIWGPARLPLAFDPAS